MKHDYLLRDYDPKLWIKVKHLAINRGQTIRQLIFDLLEFATQKIK